MMSNRLSRSGIASVAVPTVVLLIALFVPVIAPASGGQRIYLQSYTGISGQYFESQTNLVGAPDGQFGGSPHTALYGQYMALYDLGRVVTADRLEIVHKGRGTKHFKVGLSPGEPTDPGAPYLGSPIVALPGQLDSDVLTGAVISSLGPRSFRYVAVYLFNPFGADFNAPAWIDSVAVVETNNAYSANRASPAQLLVHNWSTQALETTTAFPGGAFPMNVAVTPDSRYVLAASLTDKLLYVFDKASNALAPPFVSFAGQALGVAVSPDSRTAYVTYKDNGEGWGVGSWQVTIVAKVDIASRAVSASALIGPAYATSLVVTPDGKYVIAMFDDWDTLEILNASNLQRVKNVGFQHDRANKFAVSPDSRRIYVISGGSALPTITVIDLSNFAAKEIPIPGCDYPQGIVVSPGGSRVYFACEFANYVGVLDAATEKVIATLPATDPNFLGITPDGRRLWVGEWSANDVKVFDTATNQVVPPFIPLNWTGVNIAFAGARYASVDAVARLIGMSAAMQGGGGCVPGGTYVITANWLNTSSQAWIAASAEIAALTGGNQLIDQQFNMTPDFIVTPGETMTATFRIRLAACAPFGFKVALLAVAPTTPVAQQATFTKSTALPHSSLSDAPPVPDETFTWQFDPANAH